MEVKISERNTIVVVSVSGEIDAKVVSQFSTMLSDAAYRLSSVVLEMERVDYIGSAGIQVLLTVLKTCRVRGGDLRLCTVQPIVQRVLRVSGFLGMVQVYADVDAAVASFAHKG